MEVLLVFVTLTVLLPFIIIGWSFLLWLKDLQDPSFKGVLHELDKQVSLPVESILWLILFFLFVLVSNIVYIFYHYIILSKKSTGEKSKSVNLYS